MSHSTPPPSTSTPPSFPSLSLSPCLFSSFIPASLSHQALCLPLSHFHPSFSVPLHLPPSPAPFLSCCKCHTRCISLDSVGGKWTLLATSLFDAAALGSFHILPCNKIINLAILLSLTKFESLKLHLTLKTADFVLLLHQCSENSIWKVLKSFRSLCTVVSVLQASKFMWKPHSVHRPVQSVLTNTSETSTDADTKTK